MPAGYRVATCSRNCRAPPTSVTSAGTSTHMSDSIDLDHSSSAAS